MKNILTIYFLTLFFFAGKAAFGQILTSTPTPQPTPDEDSIVKVSTTLIQVDVTVTDKKGNQITNLKPEDFEIYENGVRQDITNLSYISAGNDAAKSDVQKFPDRSKQTDIPIPPAALKPEQIRRTYAVVIDDLGLSFESIFTVQQSLRKFINEQMKDGDLAAIIRTGGGIGALQSFTNDKRLLLAAINKLRWNPQSRGDINTFAPIQPDFKDDLAKLGKTDGNDSNPQGSKEDKEFQNQIDEFRNENFAVGTLGALNYIIRGMRELPGRKSIMLVSEGFPIVSDNKPTRIFDALRILADLSNRSSVVFYTIDPRGLQVPGMANASDDIGIIPSGPVQGNDLAQREVDFQDSQQSLRYLAYETGGFPFVNQNDVSVGLRKALEDQKGYYLIGYQPDSETFDPKKNKFNRLIVKVKKPDLKIRYRSGFFGITDEKITQVTQTKQQQLYSALTSPFGANDINLNLYAVSGNDPKIGNYIRSLVYIDAKDLKFSKEPDGSRKANFDIITTTFGDNGSPVDTLSKNYTMQVSEEVYQNLLQKGFIYNFQSPIKKPGSYQFRIALRDSNLEKVGSASQYVEVPNIKKNLFVSKLILSGFTPEQWQKLSAGQDVDFGKSREEISSDVILRRFKSGTILHYYAIIYNAKQESLRNSNVQIQVRLFRESKLVTESGKSPIQTTGQSDLQRIETAGTIKLGKTLQPGNYILQLVVSDITNITKQRFSTQYVEFEILE